MKLPKQYQGAAKRRLTMVGPTPAMAKSNWVIEDRRDAPVPHPITDEMNKGPTNVLRLFPDSVAKSMADQENPRKRAALRAADKIKKGKVF